MSMAASLSPSRLARGLLRVAPEVESALNGSPLGPLASRLVLLESAILTHGMPHPANLQTARAVQDLIREKGAIPATVAVIDGQLHVGVDDSQLQRLCQPESDGGGAKIKVSRRDLPFALRSRGPLLGGTTVCGTLSAAAALDWPPIFVTGGIGGVHRGAETSMDVSADLVELGRASTAVVCAGVKSILDVGRTLEVLETQGVAVATMASDDFPAFFSRSSGCRSPHRVESVEEAASRIVAHRRFNGASSGGSGFLLGVPIPESAAAEGQEIEDAIQRALREAEASGVSGRDVTPFVLARVNEQTGGKSLAANIALVLNNASVGAQIAVEISKNVGKESERTHFVGGKSSPAASVSSKRPLVIGGSVFDLVTCVEDSDIRMNGSTHLGSVQLGFGGVGRNLADALARFGQNPLFLSAVGGDDLGRQILGHNAGLDKSGVLVSRDLPTAVYNVILDGDGEAKMGVGDMSVHKTIDEAAIDAALERVGEASIILVDGNLEASAIEHVLAKCAGGKTPLLFEPTDFNKATKVVGSRHLSSITYCTPNRNELAQLLGRDEVSDDIVELATAASTLLSHMQVLVVTLGEGGVLVVRRGHADDPLPVENDPAVTSSLPVWSARHYSLLAPVAAGQVVSVNGAGDCFAAAFVTSALAGRHQDCAVSAGLQAAGKSVAVAKAVPHDMGGDDIDWEKRAPGVDIVRDCNSVVCNN